MKAFVTGAAGFVASHLVDRLTADGHEVVGFDPANPASHVSSVVCGDLRDLGAVTSAMRGCDTVFHFGAIADIASNWKYPQRLFDINTLGTAHVLEAMRANGIRKIAFASSDAVYGRTDGTPQSENCPWPTQTSLYGASKVAGEALIQAYAAGQGFDAWIFRFCPVIGERHTHGHIPDFVRALLRDPARLEVRGTGHERKCRIYVKDAVGAVLHVMARAPAGVYNVAGEVPWSIRDSVKWVTDAMNVSPEVTYLGGDTGYSAQLWPEVAKLWNADWRPGVPIGEAVGRTVRWLLENRWALEERK